jgi:hypothetical protein
MQTSSATGLDAGAVNGPRLLLAEHHHALEEAGSELLACTYADEPRALAQEYRVFEREVLDHLAAEELVILPGYQVDSPGDAAAIRADHAAIRQQLFRVGLEIDLHLIRAHTIERLLSQLREHAQREDTAMYPWAQVHLPLSTKRRLFVRLARGIKTLVALRGRH